MLGQISGSALALDIQVIINSLFKFGITMASYFFPIELSEILSYIHFRVMGGIIQGSSLQVKKTLCPCRMPLVQKSQCFSEQQQMKTLAWP